MNAPAPEPVRMVIWDLDETFWQGTLSEGGITYQRAVHDIVVALAQRGIVSSICSRNDIGPVREVLQREGLWDYFVFPSVEWGAKGPRLAALVEAVQLRPPTILFIDDNPANLAEAQSFVPGIQVADPGVLQTLLESPLLKGKDDSALTRLAQYRLLQTRHEDAATAPDNTEFLRASGITVTIEHNVQAHLDRAIELVNRTNQLNFTKSRLPENPERARQMMRDMLTKPNHQGALVRVRDRYGDHGYCGFYLLRNARGSGKHLLQFCFSCRVLGMGVETWLYRRLGRPEMRVVGDVLSDPVGGSAPGMPEIDWITVARAGEAGEAAAPVPTMDVAYLRGACHVRPMSHYFAMVAREVVEGFDTVRDGRTMPLNHSLFGYYAIHGVPAAAKAAFAKLGYTDEDFAAFTAPRPAGERGVWVLNYWTELAGNVYRHVPSGALIPVAFSPQAADAMAKKLGPASADARSWDAAAAGVDPAIIDLLRQEFEFVGSMPDHLVLQNMVAMIRQAPPGIRVFLLLANEMRLLADGSLLPSDRVQRINALARQAVEACPGALLLDAKDCVRSKDDLMVEQPLKLQPAVYFRIYEEIVRRWDEAENQPPK